MLKVHTTRSGNVSVICVQGRIVRGEIEALRSAEERRFLLMQRKLQNLVADQHQLADQVHHLVEQIDVDPNAAVGRGRGCLMRIVARGSFRLAHWM